MKQTTRKLIKQFRRQLKATIKLLKLLTWLSDNCTPSRELYAAMLVVSHKAEQEVEQRRVQLKSKLHEEMKNRENRKKDKKAHLR